MVIDFEEIKREYNFIRLENEHIHNEREMEIITKIPEYKKLTDEASSLSIERARSALMKNGGLTKEEYAEKLDKIKKKKVKLIKDAGYPDNFLDPIYKCSACLDTGFIGKPGSTKNCVCRMKKISKYLYKFSGLQALIDDNNFENYTTDYYRSEEDVDKYNKIYKVCKAYCEHFLEPDFYEEIIFYGNVGAGKTFFATSIAKEIMDKGKIVMFITAQDFVNLFLMKDKKPEQKEYLDYIYSCDLLILDDLGAESVNQYSISSILDLITQRLTAKLPIIYTTNLVPNDISEIYGPRILSRMTARMNLIEFPVTDLRGIKLLAREESNKLRIT